MPQPLGGRVMVREFDSQVAEMQVRTGILNQFTILGTHDRGGDHSIVPIAVWRITNCPDLCNKAKFQ